MKPTRLAPNELRVITADRGDDGRRIDLVLRRHLQGVPHATRTRVQRWIADGQVTVNGEPVRRVAARAAHADVLTVLLPVAVLPAPMLGEEQSLVVLHEDEHLLVIDKPSGMVAHPTRAHPGGTLMNALVWHARDWSAPLARPSLIGRLDRLTSGIVLVAKSAAVHSRLQRVMASPACEKDYLAVVYGVVHEGPGVIELPIHDDRAARRRVASSTAPGLPSLTRFESLAQVALPRAGLSLLRCRLVTGRTHQIRVHLLARGWPIVGDGLYGEPRWAQVENPDLAAALAAFPRQALHAWRLGFVHPCTGVRLSLEAAVPPDIRALLRQAGLPTDFPSA